LFNPESLSGLVVEEYSTNLTVRNATIEDATRRGPTKLDIPYHMIRIPIVEPYEIIWQTTDRFPILLKSVFNNFSSFSLANKCKAQ
tara:strand:+ start:192 stop:449 length:258 start_codon:yes stop_codon:yes gene_type:complete